MRLTAPCRNTRNRAPMALPLDVRLMNAAATAVFALAALVLVLRRWRSAGRRGSRCSRCARSRSKAS